MRAPNFVGCVRARGLPFRQPASQPVARARWLLNARPVAKTDARIVFLSEFWVQESWSRGKIAAEKLQSVWNFQKYSR